MDEILTAFGFSVLLVAILAALATQVLKRIVPEEYKALRFYEAALNFSTVVISFFLVFVAQRMGWLMPGWEWLVASGILTAGLAVLGYEGVKNVIRGVAGDRTGRDTVNIQDVHGENIDIGGG